MFLVNILLKIYRKVTLAKGLSSENRVFNTK